MLKMNTNRGSHETKFDIIVVGAGSGGTAAAIQAARMGAKTLLIEPSGHIGGQLLVVPTMDEGFVDGNGFPIRNAGLYAEFITHIRKKYQKQGKSTGTCYWRADSIAYEPAVGEQVISKMLANEPLITIHTHMSVNSVLVHETEVTGITTTSGKTFHCKILVDATECGDLIPLTPARYRVGKSNSDKIDHESCIQDITFPAVVKRYPGGPPDHLVINSPPPHYPQHRAQFQATVHRQGHNWYKNDCGENQDQPCWGRYPVDWTTHHAYRGLPDSSHDDDYSAQFPEAKKISKTLINWANDISVNVSYLEDENQREQDNANAKIKTLCFIYYLQQELGKEWSISDDEPFTSIADSPSIPPQWKEIAKRFPPQPYVRESRRIIPLRTLTALDINREGDPPKAKNNFLHSVAVGFYPADLHGCKDNSSFNEALENKSYIPDGFISGPFQIPFESLIPEEIDGFLAAEKNIGVTRIVNGAIRLQPITMVIGQAVGAIASLAIKEGVKPRFLDPLLVQDELLQSKNKLSTHFYQDVPITHPLWKAVELVSTRQLLKEDDEFGISEPISRAELAKALSRYLDIAPPPQPSSPSFQDVDHDHPNFAHIEAVHNKVPFPPSRRGKDCFCPSDAISRQEMLAVLTGSLRGTSHHPALRLMINDKDDQWSDPWIEKIKEWGIGIPREKGILPPHEKLSRGEAAAIFYTLLINRLD